MTNWFEKILENPKQASQALAEGATGGLSKITSPALGELFASAASKSYREDKTESPLKDSYKLYNEQRGKYAQENPFLNMALQAAGSLPMTIAGGGTNLASQAKFGAATGFSQSTTDTASKALAGQKPNESDGINTLLSTGLGATGAPIGAAIGRGIGAITNKVISPAVKDIYKGIAGKDPGVGVLVDNLKKLSKDKIGKVRDFLGASESGDYQALSEQMQKDISRGYNEGIRKEVNPRYNKIFYRTNKQGAQEPYKIAPTELSGIYQNDKYESVFNAIKNGLEDDPRILAPDGSKAPENSLAYIHAVRSQAKGLLNGLKKGPIDQNYAGKLAQENNLRSFIKDLDGVVDRNLPVGKKTDLALTDERYSKLVGQRDSALTNLNSGEITKANKDRIISYAGKDFEPHVDTIDLVNKSYDAGLKGGSANPRDAYREGQLAVDLATGNKMGAIRNIGKMADRLITGQKAESEIGGYGNFLTSDEGKSLLGKLYDSKSLADRNVNIKEGVSKAFQRTGESLVTQTAPNITPELLNKRKTLTLPEKAISFDPTPKPLADIFGGDEKSISQPLQININRANGTVPNNYPAAPQSALQPLSLQDIGL